MKFFRRILFIVISAALLVSPVCASAANVGNLAKGEYDISSSLSCYVNAMGGVEFGKPLMTSSTLIVDGSGNMKIRMYFTKSSVTIYSVTCDTFVDANPGGSNERGVQSGTIGYYDKNGNLKTDGVDYTLSSDTAENSRKEQVNYVDSITFPVDSVRDSYSLTLYINSNVMGVQFCNENSSATEATYPATLTVNWDSVQGGSSSQKTNSGSNANGNSGNSGSGSNAAAAADSKSNGGGTGSGSAANGGANTQNGAAQKNAAQTAAAGESSSAGGSSSGTVVEKAGLNVHYANADDADGLGNDEKVSGESVSGSSDDVPFYVYLNMPFLIGMIIFGALVAVGGGVLLYISKKQKGKSANENKSERNNENNENNENKG